MATSISSSAAARSLASPPNWSDDEQWYDPEPPGRLRSVSWLVSAVVHAVAFLLFALVGNPPPPAGNSTPERRAGIVLVDLSTESPQYFEPGADDAVGGESSAVAASAANPSDSVLAPPGAAARLIGSPALLAWNGSAEAARAIAAAVQLLAKSPKVVIFAAAEKDPAADASHLKDYLDWHGVKAEGPVAGRDDATTGAKLLETAGQIGAGLLVLGAYTRSRMRQLIYGSVTRHVLNNGTLCTLMAH